MGSYDFTPPPDKIPDTKPASAGGPPQPPPRPPKLTPRDLMEPEGSADFINIKDLAEMLALKPFKIVADVMELGQFKHADEAIDFPTAAIVARKHGYLAVKSDWNLGD